MFRKENRGKLLAAALMCAVIVALGVGFVTSTHYSLVERQPVKVPLFGTTLGYNTGSVFPGWLLYLLTIFSLGLNVLGGIIIGLAIAQKPGLLQGLKVAVWTAFWEVPESKQ